MKPFKIPGYRTPCRLPICWVARPWGRARARARALPRSPRASACLRALAADETASSRIVVWAQAICFSKIHTRRNAAPPWCALRAGISVFFPIASVNLTSRPYRAFDTWCEAKTAGLWAALRDLERPGEQVSDQISSLMHEKEPKAHLHPLRHE